MTCVSPAARLRRRSRLRHSVQHMPVRQIPSRPHLEQLHRRRMGAVAIGPPVREPEPRRPGRSDRPLPGIDARRRRRRAGRRAPRLFDVAPRAGAAPRRDPAPGGADHRRPQGAVCPRHDARNGQGARGNARRRPGSHRHDELHGGRGAPAVRPDRPLGAARQVRDVGPAADWRLLDHHAVELSDGDPVVEDRAGARLRQYRRVQARLADAAFGHQLRRGAAGGRSAAWRGQPRDRWAGRRDAAFPGRPRVGRLLHRLHRRRPRRQPERRGRLQEGPPRDGRQERRHDHGRRAARAGRRGLPVGRIRDDRTAVHRRQPRRRPPQRVRRLHRASS